MSFAFNTPLSGKSLSLLAKPAATPLLWDREPWHLHGRNVCYADGHVTWSLDFKPPVPAKDIWAKTKCCEGEPAEIE